MGRGEEEGWEVVERWRKHLEEQHMSRSSPKESRALGTLEKAEGRAEGGGSSVKTVGEAVSTPRSRAL
jgi:hypothetical protein